MLLNALPSAPRHCQVESGLARLRFGPSRSTSRPPFARYGAADRRSHWPSFPLQLHAYAFQVQSRPSQNLVSMHTARPLRVLWLRTVGHSATAPEAERTWHAEEGPAQGVETPQRRREIVLAALRPDRVPHHFTCVLQGSLRTTGRGASGCRLHPSAHHKRYSICAWLWPSFRMSMEMTCC